MAIERSFDAGEQLWLHVEIQGSGPPLLLLHGFTGSVRSWDALADSLAASRTVIAVDLPGHGQSSAPSDPQRYSHIRFAGDLAHLLDDLGHERIAVLGYSMGGRAALRFAVSHPSRVAALVFESTSAGIADRAERDARVASDGLLADVIERDGVPSFVANWERLSLWKSQRALSAEVRARLRAQRLANDPAGLANSLRGAGAGSEDSIVEQLTLVTAPALVVAGALDMLYVNRSEVMCGALPDCRMLIVPEAGHAIHVEKPDAFATAVNQFLDGVPSAGDRWA